jgi:hypothetical protein
LLDVAVPFFALLVIIVGGRKREQDVKPR